MTFTLVVIYSLIGLLVGLRTSTIIAWRVLRRVDDPHYSLTWSGWWQHPAPFFSLLGCIVAWPLVVLGYLLRPLSKPFGRSFLFAPPRETRNLKNEHARNRDLRDHR